MTDEMEINVTKVNISQNFWNTCPQKLKDEIFKHLNFDDVMSCSLACKGLYIELGRSKVAMDKLKFRVKDSWSDEVKKMLNESPRQYTYINIYSSSGPQNTVEYFKNYPHWTHICLELIQFDNGNDWINYVNSFPSTLEYLKINNIKVPYNNKRVVYTKPKVPLINVKVLHMMEDPDENKMFLKRTGYYYAPYHALLAFGEMPQLKKLIIACTKDFAMKQYNLPDNAISDYFKHRKWDELELLVVGHEKLSIGNFRSISTRIKKLYLFGYEDTLQILEIWNAMSDKGLEVMSIGFMNHDCVLWEYSDFSVTDRVHKNQEQLNTTETLKSLILCYDRFKMPLCWYRNFFKAAPCLTTIKIKWLRKDVLKSAIKMLPKLQAICYEKFYDPSEDDDDDDGERDDKANDTLDSTDEFEEVQDMAVYYNLIKASRNDVNKNVTILKETVRNRFKCKDD